jgi:alkanesulfonate monooxygenase SsuD/methylene tetrahydromethanopterin reductase-like flavin-dependent oxidoreductase (luciferase family)
MSTGADVANLARLADDLWCRIPLAAEHVVVPGTYGSHDPHHSSGMMADDHFPRSAVVWLAYAAATRIELATGSPSLPAKHPHRRHTTRHAGARDVR